MTARRYPLEPLAQHLGITLGTTGGHQPDDDLLTLADLADRLRISHRHARRLHHEGLTEDQADRAAIDAGSHPSEIWPEWFDDLDIDQDDVA